MNDRLKIATMLLCETTVVTAGSSCTDEQRINTDRRNLHQIDECLRLADMLIEHERYTAAQRLNRESENAASEAFATVRKYGDAPFESPQAPVVPKDLTVAQIRELAAKEFPVSINPFDGSDENAEGAWGFMVGFRKCQDMRKGLK